MYREVRREWKIMESKITILLYLCLVMGAKVWKLRFWIPVCVGLNAFCNILFLLNRDNAGTGGKKCTRRKQDEGHR